MDKKLKIIAVIPIYFPDDSLYDNINTYIEYIDCLIIINNSQSIIDNFKNHLQTDKIIFYNPEKNIGLSKSYNFALSYAISNFYDYLLIMDQDSKFIKYSIWQHLNYLIKDSKIALISASSSKDRSDYINIYNDNFYERKIIMSSGTFLAIESAKKIGYFDEEFFIDEIDHDYSLKCYKQSFFNISSYDVFLSHSVGESHKVSKPMNNFKKEIIIHKPFRYYHIFRNGRIMFFRYLFIEPNFSFRKLYLLLKNVVKIVLFYPNKTKYFFYILKSFKNERN